MSKLLTVIIPSFNEEEMIVKTSETIDAILSQAQIAHELLFIDDGSKDGTWEQIIAAAQKIPSIHGIRFSRNFGKEAAISAGLSKAHGDCAVVIDCDLQHPPEKIVEMYRLWESGYQIVEAAKKSRGSESALHALFARIFYKLIKAATGFDMLRASDFKLLDRKAIDVLTSMQEHNGFFRGLSFWVGFKTTQIEFEVQERTCGVSKWSFLSLIRYAFSNIASFSTFPMHLVTIMGAFFLVIAFIFGGISLTQKLNGSALTGFTTVILLMLFANSIIMISLGIIGYYIARCYQELQRRPRFIIAQECHARV